MPTLNLKIITPERIVLEKQVDRIVAKSTEGELAILPGHEPLVTTLAIDVVRFDTGKEEEFAAIMGGILEVRADEVTVLSDVAELDAEIDEARAKAAADKARAEKMERKENLDVYVTEMAISKAITRLRAVELRNRRRKPLG